MYKQSSKRPDSAVQIAKYAHSISNEIMPIILKISILHFYTWVSEFILSSKQTVSTIQWCCCNGYPDAWHKKTEWQQLTFWLHCHTDWLCKSSWYAWRDREKEEREKDRERERDRLISSAKIVWFDETPKFKTLTEPNSTHRRWNSNYVQLSSTQLKT